MVKNIIFDLSEVIISGYHGAEYVIEKNSSVSAEKFLKRKKEVEGVFLDTMRGLYSEDEYLKCMLDGTDWEIGVEELKKYMRENLNIPVDGVMEIVRGLKGRYNLVLLSDYMREWMEYILENNDDIGIFDCMYFSCESGRLKSDEGTFKRVLEDCGFEADETIFVDDYASNVDVAVRYGIDGIVFKSAVQLEDELRRRKVLWK